MLQEHLNIWIVQEDEISQVWEGSGKGFGKWWGNDIQVIFYCLYFIYKKNNIKTQSPDTISLCVWDKKSRKIKLKTYEKNYIKNLEYIS